MRFAKKKNDLFMLILLLILVPLIMLISLRIGYTNLTMVDIVKTAIGQGKASDALVLFQFRLPRIFIAFLVGIGFAVSGAILQGVAKNPLADPGILGINAGAGLVVVLFITVIGNLGFASIFMLPFFSLVGAGLAGTIIYWLSTSKYKGIQPIRLVLNGVAIQAGVNGLMMVLILLMDSDQTDFLARWQAGSIWKSSWNLVIVLVPWIVLGLILAFSMHRSLDILGLGDEGAIGVGLQVKKNKRRLLFLAIMMAASAVAISGSISFVGLMAPHMSKRLVSPKHRFIIPASALIGGNLVMIADMIGRKIAEPDELPTGIVVAAIGAPYFLYLLLKERKTTIQKQAN